MVAKITIGSGLFGAIKYNADKVNEGKGQLLDTNKIFNDGTGKVDIAQACMTLNGTCHCRCARKNQSSTSHSILIPMTD